MILFYSTCELLYAMWSCCSSMKFEKLTLNLISFVCLLSSPSLSELSCNCCCFVANFNYTSIISKNQTTASELFGNLNCSVRQTTTALNCTHLTAGEWNQSSEALCFQEINGTLVGGTLDKNEIMKLEKNKTSGFLDCNFSGHPFMSSAKPENLTTKVCCQSNPKVPPKRSREREKLKDVYIGLLFVADVFLLLTLIVYLIIWENHTVHGWTIFSEVLSNFLMILTVALAHLDVRDLYDTKPPTNSCILLATISHFFFLSTFCWMTAINFNLWRNLSSLKRPLEGRRRKVKLYLFYALFAIGLPLLVVIVGVILDVVHHDKKAMTSNNNGTITTTMSSGIIKRPNYGKKFCYIAKDAQGHYIYYPIGTLIVSNVVLFILTICTLVDHRHSTRRALGGRKDESVVRSGHDRPTQSVLLFAKLFCVMGVSWVFEVIAWAFSKSGEDVPLYWVIFDVTNLVQGIAVFIVFVCKKDVFVLVRTKLQRFHMWTK